MNKKQKETNAVFYSLDNRVCFGIINTLTPPALPSGCAGFCFA